MRGKSLRNVGHGTFRLASAFPGLTVIPDNVNPLLRSLKLGLTSFIDTAPNYGDGTAHRIVADTLKKLDAEERKNVRIATKFGFIEGSTFQFHRTTPFENAFKVTDSAFHCLDLSFLRFQLGRATKLFGCVDLFFIHCPELSFFPQESLSSGSDMINQPRLNQESIKQEFLTIFTELESQKAKGTINSYGISSNSFSLPVDHPNFLQFDSLLDIADEACRKVGKFEETGFKAIQLPANIIETVALKPEHEGGNGIAQWANDNDIEVITNRPLSAFSPEGVFNLVEPLDIIQPEKDYAQVRNNLLEHLSPILSTEDGISQEDIDETLEACAFMKKLVQDMESQMLEFDNSAHFNADLQEKILPVLNERIENIDETTFELLSKYFLEYEKMIKFVTGKKAREFVEKRYPNSLDQNEPLQDLALKFLLEHELIDTVLIGMNNISSVDHVQKLVESIEGSKNEV